VVAVADVVLPGRHEQEGAAAADSGRARAGVPLAGYAIAASEAQDRAFLVEMARLACGLEDRPLPAADDPDVVALLPGQEDTALIATDDDGRPIGAAWWHIHEPPMLRDESGEPLPEMTMAVAEGHRGKGVGRALIEALSAKAAEHFSVLTLNVHLRNPAAHLYTRTGFFGSLALAVAGSA
jgi:GNAT superfamily N-acetyltransferase